MELKLHDDGCIVANTNTRLFIVEYSPKCEHAAARNAEIVVRAVSRSDAMKYAETWLALPQMYISNARAAAPESC